MVFPSMHMHYRVHIFILYFLYLELLVVALDYKVGEAAGLVEAGDTMEQEGGVVRPHHSRCHGGLTPCP